MTLHLTSQGFAQLSPHVTFPPATCEVSTEQSQGSQIWGGELFFFFQTSFNAGGPSCLLERVAPCRVAVLPGWEAEPLAETQAGTSEARRLWRVCAQQLGQAHVFNRSQNRYEYSQKGNMDVCDRQTCMLHGSHLHLGVEASHSNAL